MNPLVISTTAVLCLLTGCGKSAPISHREAATQEMASYLARELKPRAVLVLSNPFTQKPGRPPEVYAFEKAGLAGLKKGFGEKIPLKVFFPELRPEAESAPGSVHIDPNTTTPLSFLVSDNAFQKAIDQNRECDLVISLIGVPLNLHALAAWKTPGAPRFALLFPDLRMLGGADGISNAFRTGKLAALAVRKPALNETEPQFLLVTSKNAEDILRNQPQLFAP